MASIQQVPIVHDFMDYHHNNHQEQVTDDFEIDSICEQLDLDMDMDYCESSEYHNNNSNNTYYHDQEQLPLTKKEIEALDDGDESSDDDDDDDDDNDVKSSRVGTAGAGAGAGGSSSIDVNNNNNNENENEKLPQDKDTFSSISEKMTLFKKALNLLPHGGSIINNDNNINNDIDGVKKIEDDNVIDHTSTTIKVNKKREVEEEGRTKHTLSLSGAGSGMGIGNENNNNDDDEIIRKRIMIQEKNKMMNDPNNQNTFEEELDTYYEKGLKVVGDIVNSVENDKDTGYDSDQARERLLEKARKLVTETEDLYTAGGDRDHSGSHSNSNGMMGAGHGYVNNNNNNNNNNLIDKVRQERYKSSSNKNGDDNTTFISGKIPIKKRTATTTTTNGSTSITAGAGAGGQQGNDNGSNSNGIVDRKSKTHLSSKKKKRRKNPKKRGSSKTQQEEMMMMNNIDSHDNNYSNDVCTDSDSGDSCWSYYSDDSAVSDVNNNNDNINNEDNDGHSVTYDEIPIDDDQSIDSLDGAICMMKVSMDEKKKKIDQLAKEEAIAKAKQLNNKVIENKKMAGIPVFRNKKNVKDDSPDTKENVSDLAKRAMNFSKPNRDIAPGFLNTSITSNDRKEFKKQQQQEQVKRMTEGSASHNTWKEVNAIAAVIRGSSLVTTSADVREFIKRGDLIMINETICKVAKQGEYSAKNLQLVDDWQLETCLEASLYVKSVSISKSNDNSNSNNTKQQIAGKNRRQRRASTNTVNVKVLDDIYQKLVKEDSVTDDMSVTSKKSSRSAGSWRKIDLPDDPRAKALARVKNQKKKLENERTKAAAVEEELQRKKNADSVDVEKKRRAAARRVKQAAEMKKKFKIDQEILQNAQQKEEQKKYGRQNHETMDDYIERKRKDAAKRLFKTRVEKENELKKLRKLNQSLRDAERGEIHENSETFDTESKNDKKENIIEEDPEAKLKKKFETERRLENVKKETENRLKKMQLTHLNIEEEHERDMQKKLADYKSHLKAKVSKYTRLRDEAGLETIKESNEVKVEKNNNYEKLENDLADYKSDLQKMYSFCNTPNLDGPDSPPIFANDLDFMSTVSPREKTMNNNDDDYNEFVNNNSNSKQDDSHHEEYINSVKKKSKKQPVWKQKAIPLRPLQEMIDGNKITNHIADSDEIINNFQSPRKPSKKSPGRSPYKSPATGQSNKKTPGRSPIKIHESSLPSISSQFELDEKHTSIFDLNSSATYEDGGATTSGYLSNVMHSIEPSQLIVKKCPTKLCNSNLDNLSFDPMDILNKRQRNIVEKGNKRAKDMLENEM